MVVNQCSWQQQSRHSDRGSACLFAPIVEFNVLAEVGDTPP
jgi:hypothetical protein